MKNKFLITSLFFLSFLFLSHQALASSGTIDPTYHYAWGENIGWVDFAQATVSDTTLGGYAYGENIGWINLGSITNNNGDLSGYAWGENVGFIDFSQVTINKGVFEGQAYGENIGWITFGNENNKVVTDWRPQTHSSSGSTVSTRYTNLVAMGKTDEATKLAQQFPNQINTPSTTSICTTPTITKTLKLTTPLIKSDEVKQLQTYLNCHQSSNLTTDGIFGKQTKQSVILFQKANNLTPDGIVGPLTRARLK